MMDGDTPQYAVDVTDHIWIPMPDGIRLAARLWLPNGALVVPVPALLETIPYRKADMVRARDERNHPFFATHGYACLRVDMRGSGDSDGIMTDMYRQEELDDTREVIEWIADQPWCNGSVGMFGTSWGGTAALQASINAPDPLKAAIAVCATHDRYTDDIHHMGGCLLTDSLEWGTTLPCILASPPTANVGSNWMALWKKRLDCLSFPLSNWVREEACGAYWRHGSVIHQIGSLDRPVLAVGGWSDRYSNSVMTLVDARPDLVWGVVGPWGHHYPDHGHPRPAIGFQQLALQWWDKWLKPSDKDELETSKLRVWLCEFEEPRDNINERKGSWIEAGSTAEHTRADAWHLTGTGLSCDPANREDRIIPSNLHVGLNSSETGYFGRLGGHPPDQREDDAHSLVFDTEPFGEDYVLFGWSNLFLTLASDCPRSQVAVRINDIAPDGTSNRVVLALCNLALDENQDAPTAPVGRNRMYGIRFPTRAYRFRKGHKLRLSISSSYWPMIWPPPKMEQIVLKDGTLTIPAFVGDPQNDAIPLPSPIDLPETKNHETISSPPLQRYSKEFGSNEMETGWHQPPVRVRYFETDTEFEYETHASHHMKSTDPLTAVSMYEHRMTFDRPDGTARVECSVTASCDAGNFVLKARMLVHWNNSLFHEASWDYRIPRHYS